MNIPDFLSSSIAEALGWTLVHSLWQGLIITGIVALLLKIISSRASNYRYTIALAGLLLLVTAIGITFTKLYTTESIYAPTHTLTLPQDYSYTITDQAPDGLLITIRQFMDANMKWFIACWFAGAVFFLLRVAGGSIYVSMLRRDSLSMAEEWNARVQDLAAQLNIQRTVTLAQSARVHAPIVLGYIKPLIIIPTGMLSGLSTDQLEAIFLHELVHIKRHDYLVNLFQMFMEAFLFFNPFVWILSNMIRNEREHCCDDAVVSRTGNAKLYAAALVQLEEVRLSQAGIALSLAENKNLLLKRIKRLMEKSVKNYTGRDRIIPVALLVVGLMCASWLTMSRSQKATIQNIGGDERQVHSDTVIKNKSKSAGYSRTVITTTDENGVTHEEVVESTDGEDVLAPVAPLDVTMEIPPIPAFPDFPALPMMMNIDLHLDSIPPPMPAPAFEWSDHQWEEAAQEFENSFKEKFSEFYKTHEADFDKMMEELKTKYDDKHLDQIRAELDEINLSHKMAAIEKEMEVREEAVAAMEKAIAVQEESMKRWQKDHEQEMQRLELKMKAQEENMQKFETELTKELVKDGYIKKDEKLKEINWSNGSIRINGKEIKGSDKDKYQKLYKKYMTDNGNFNYIHVD